MKRIFIASILAFSGIVSTSACTNPETPAGYEGYVYHVPVLFGQMEFRGPMRGPATTGVSWRLFVENIDMRKQSYIESFSLLTSDNLNVSFEVSTRIKPKDGSVKEIVEQWGGDKWYEWNVKEPLRTTVRREVISISATNIQLRTQEVRQQIFDKLAAQYADAPFTIESVDIGEIQFPKEVTAAIQKKISTKQELERQEYVLQKTAKEAAIRVLEALKVAKQQHIISSTLDPIYVQRKAIQVYRQLAESPNKTVIMLPNSTEGTGMPLVLTEGKRKILTANDEKLLKKMEDQYMKIASSSDVEESADEPATPPAADPESAEPPPDNKADAPVPASPDSKAVPKTEPRKSP